MAKFKPEIDSFRAREAMRFLLNFLRNCDVSDSHRERIADCDVFATPARIVRGDELFRWCEVEIAEDVRKRAEKHCSDPDYIEFEDGPREFLRHIWNSSGRSVRMRLVAFLGEQAKRLRSSAREAFRVNFCEYCDTLCLPPLDRDLLLASYLLRAKFLEWPDRESSRSIAGRVEILAMYVDHGVDEVRAALSASAPLRRYGCLDRDFDLGRGLSLASSVPLPRIVEAARAFRRELADGAASDAIDSPRLNLLLSGPPGTGKTEFVKYLGAELGAKVVVKMGSDLLNCFVGGTEANIARAFREAEASNAILFLDEVDGLLRSRASADRSWEVTQVNELLHQMENFRGILVCATNFSDNLDPATIRRFTFKVEFDYLGNDGKALFFKRFFGRSLTNADRATLDAIPSLAPGDFRTVRQSMRYLGGCADNAALLGALRDESKAKRSRGQGHVGF